MKGNKTMTKKDYILISNVFNTTAKIWIEALNKWKNKLEESQTTEETKNIEEKIDGINKILASLDIIVKGLCFELQKDNPLFDESKFKEACGLPIVKNNEIYPTN